MKTAIITDSGTALSAKESKELGIFFLPLQIDKDQQVMLDGVNVSLEDIYGYLHEEANLTTSQPPIGTMEEVMEEIKAQGYDEAVAITICPGLSSTMSTLQARFKYNDIPLECVDTYTTCGTQQYLAKCAKLLADKGYDAKTIAQRLRDSVAHSDTLIIPDDLQHLKRGGRLTPIAAALGGLLKIKPILKLNESSEGKIDVYAKVRTMSKAMNSVVETFKKANLNQHYLMHVLNSDAPEEGAKFAQMMEEAFPDMEIITGSIGAVISVHTGIGCLGAQYIRKVDMS